MGRREMVKITVILTIVLSGIWGCLLASNLPSPAQDTKTLLFQDATTAMEQAKTGQADIYSPEHYASAVKYLQQAEEDFQKGKSIETTREKIRMAEIYFAKASESAKLFESNFSSCVSARTDALAAEAPQYRDKEWQEAEKILNQAAKILEKGNLNSARSKADKAEEMYRGVELESIEANYLDDTRSLLKNKEREIRKAAPLTLDKAWELINKAEKLLSENRYDTDEARQLAAEAKYEAQHAIYLADIIDRMKEKDITVEKLLLESETPIQKIADELDMNPRFHQGPDQPVQAIVDDIHAKEKQITELQQDLADQKEQVSALSGQLSQLESQLGDLKSKEATLSEIMEQQRISRQKFTNVESMFTSEEAQVLRVEDQVIVRLYGLTFPVGKAVIEPQYYGLLTKVLSAMDEYPDSKITIEGHTDSWGSDETNQRLSTERAEAVMQYFMATANMDSTRVDAIGYGESKPIATNETKEGRRKNRRIETIIHTKKE